ncbi:MAG: stage II sporulation protein M [Nanoarchaeota archaeon]|nr:stage II sporulation protein M [Nanoarchaeota archaeon]
MANKRILKKKKTSLLGQYKLSWNYIKESQKYIWSIVILFFLFSLIGLFFPVPFGLEGKLMDVLKELVAKTEGLKGLDLIGFIFWNNLQASFFGIVFGALLGLFPFLATVFNGYLLGFVSKIVIGKESIFSLWRLFPHGIFELPAVFISFGLGLRLGLFFIERNDKDWKYYFVNSLRVFILIVIPLLIVAAIIEGILISIAGN